MTFLNYHHLYYFKHVVDEGSIVKASELLRIGQPSISMQIKMLEDQLQKKLFIRQNKKLIPTETGKIVYEYASKIFNLGDELLNTLHDQAESHIKIQIGVQSTVPKNLISKMTSYIYKHFDSEIAIYDSSFQETSYAILNHKLDIALLNSRPLVHNKSITLSKKYLNLKWYWPGRLNFPN